MAGEEDMKTITEITIVDQEERYITREFQIKKEVSWVITNNGWNKSRLNNPHFDQSSKLTGKNSCKEMCYCPRSLLREAASLCF